MLARSVVLLAPARTPHTPCGTGFLLTAPNKQTFLVTAAHVAALSPLVAICNPLEGNTHSMLLPSAWLTHPAADLALLPLLPWPHLELTALPFSRLASLAAANDFPRPIYTLGPSVPALTDYARSRFTPTRRFGHLLSLSNSLGYLTARQARTELTPAVYVAEMSSAPGHSGSPVFADKSAEDGVLFLPSLVGLLIGGIGITSPPRAVIVPSTVIRVILLSTELP